MRVRYKKCLHYTPGYETYRREQHLHFATIGGLHKHVRLVIGKLRRGEGTLSDMTAQDRTMGARTLSTFPGNLMGCDAPMKSLSRAPLTRGDTGSFDISWPWSCGTVRRVGYCDLPTLQTRHGRAKFCYT